MARKDFDWRERGEAVLRVATDYLRDEGYVRDTLGSGEGVRWRQEGAEWIATVTLHVRRGPHATRKTPAEEVRVDVRCTGFGGKTYRPKLVSRSGGEG